MKKKIFLMLAVMAMLVCVFAISASAMEFDKTEKVTVTLTNGTQECALYDADGDELVWYTLDGGATVISVKSKDLVYSSETDLRNISLADGTVLQKDNDNTTNHIVVANLRGRTFTNLVHNGYKSTFDQSKVIQYVYLPSTVKSIACNQYQNCTNLKVLDFPSDAKFSFNDSNFAPGCTSLLEINLTGLTGVTGGAHFSNCTSLSKVIGLENSTTTRIGKHMFNKTAITEIRLPNTLTHLGEAAFNGCKQLKVAYLGASLSTFEINSGFKASDAFNSSAIEIIYMPSTVTAVAGYTFSNANSLRVIFFTGTKDQAVAMYNASNMTNNSPFQNLGKEESQFISYEAYKALPEGDTGKYIVYGYNTCDAFYKGEHITDEQKYEFTSFTEKSYLRSVCTRCETGTVLKEIAPLFTCLGYSAPENGKGGIAIGFTVNSEAIAEYKEVTGKTLSYGVFAALKDSLNGSDIFVDGEANPCAIVADVTQYATAAFEVKIIGFETDNQKTAQIAMGAYVKVDNDYSYMQNSAPDEGDKYCFDSFNDIVAQLASKA